MTSSALDELVASIVHWSFAICGSTSNQEQADAHHHRQKVRSQLSADDQQSISSATLPVGGTTNDSDYLSGASSTDARLVILSRQDEDELVFLLELLIAIVIENKYRLTQIWPVVDRHLRWIMFGFGRNLFVVERAIVGALRVVNRSLVHLHDAETSEQMTARLLTAIAMIGELAPPALFFFSRQIANGLHQLVHQNAANVHSHDHWEILFTLMQSVGAAYYRHLEAVSF